MGNHRKSYFLSKKINVRPYYDIYYDSEQCWYYQSRRRLHCAMSCMGKSSAFWELGPIPPVWWMCGCVLLMSWCLVPLALQMSSVTTKWVNRGWFLLCISTVLLQDTLLGLSVHLDDSINMSKGFSAAEQPISSFEALSCGCLSWGWAGAECICCLGYLTFISLGKGRMGPAVFLGRTAF